MRGLNKMTKNKKPKKINTVPKISPITEAETQDIITAKMKETLNRQKQFRELYLARRFKQQTLADIETQLKSKKITMQNAYNVPFSKELLTCEYLVVRDMYINLLAEEQKYYRALCNDGLTETEINDILQYKYKKSEQNVRIAEEKKLKLNKEEYENSDLKKALDIKEKQEQEALKKQAENDKSN